MQREFVRRVVLTYADAPPSENHGGAGSRQHWSKGHALKGKWQGIWCGCLMAAKPRVEKIDYCEATIVIRWKNRNRRDETNYIASTIKPLADAMVTMNLIPDDTSEFFKFKDLTFEYPENWPHVMSKAETVVALDLYKLVPANHSSKEDS